jgi:hypothetical protein
MKTLNFYVVIFFAIMLLASCEEPSQPAPPKNNGPSLESRLCGVWNIAYSIPTSCSPEDSYPREKKGINLVINTTDNEFFYKKYNSYTNEIQQDSKMIFEDTTYHENYNVYNGTFSLCNGMKIWFLLKQDTLELHLTSINGEDIIGSAREGFIKE